ncbi:universal stress A domain protein, partial [Vibrio harveyi]
LTQDI